MVNYAEGPWCRCPLSGLAPPQWDLADGCSESDGRLRRWLVARRTAASGCPPPSSDIPHSDSLQAELLRLYLDFTL